MTILLSGTTGFLGSHLLKFLFSNGYTVVALKRSTSDDYRIKDYLDKVFFYDIDTIDLSEIFQKHVIDIVINTVANYGRNYTKPSTIVETNVLFGLKLLEESLHVKVKAFINTDTLLDRNITMYALSKSQLVDWMKILSNKETKMVNVKMEHMYGVQDDENKFIYWLISQLKQNVDKIDLTSGLQKRDFIYISDVLFAYESILKHLSSLPSFEEFELGMGKSIEVRKFVEKIVSEMKMRQVVSTELNFGAVPYRRNEKMTMQANINKLQRLGWNPTVSIEDGIKRILEAN